MHKDRKLGRQVDVKERVKLLIADTTYMSYAYIASGLFERDKIIVAAQMVMCILKQKGAPALAVFAGREDGRGAVQRSSLASNMCIQCPPRGLFRCSLVLY